MTNMLIKHNTQMFLTDIEKSSISVIFVCEFKGSLIPIGILMVIA